MLHDRIESRLFAEAAVQAILWESFVILLLILANGFFSGSELAILSARRGRIAKLAAGGNPRAILVDQLQRDSARFLATVQIGVTVVGSLASAVGGAMAVRYLQPMLANATVDFIRRGAEPLSLAVVVVGVSYLSLVLGELAPKTVGLQFADVLSLAVARPIHWMSKVSGLAVKLLTISNRAVLGIFGIRQTQENNRGGLFDAGGSYGYRRRRRPARRLGRA